MSFFPNASHTEIPNEKALGKLGCRACPLSKVQNRHPQMSPVGDEATGGIYLLGEAPGAAEDEVGMPFVGPSGKLLHEVVRSNLTRHHLPTRWNNVVRTRPPNNRAPTESEIACCKPSIVEDIEKYKPAGIIGMGGTPLRWTTGMTGANTWRGRRLPVKIGNHRCWFYPVNHPSFVLRTGGLEGTNGTLFSRDVTLAIGDIASKPPLPKEFDIGQFDRHYADFNEQNLREIFKSEVVAFDLETASSDRRDKLRAFGDGAQVMTIAFSSAGSGLTVAAPIDHPGSHSHKRDEVIQTILRVIADSPTKNLVAHNLSFDLEWMLVGMFGEAAKEFLDANRHRLKCTMSQAYVLDNRKGALSLNSLCFQYFGVNMKEFEAVNVSHINREPLDRVLRYNAIDAYFTAKLFVAQQQRLERINLTEVAEEQHLRLPTLVAATLIGLLVDPEENKRQVADLKQKLATIEITIRQIPEVSKWEADNRRPFDFDSTLQVASVLSSIGGIQIPETEKGNPSVTAEVLAGIRHPLATNIVEHRQIATLLNTFVSTMSPGGKHHWSDGRLHPKFNACRTATRRLSSSSPNGQNFPRRRNVSIRNQIIAPEGSTIVSVDYGQIEARIIAADSQDEVFVRSILDGTDIHQSWAERILTAYPRWTAESAKERRDKAKGGMVFASFYLASANTVAASVGIPVHIAQALLQDFWREFRGVKEWQRRLISQYRQRGFLELCTGFRCRGSFSDYQIVNYRVQGSASDIVVGAMTRLSMRGIQAVLNIHDDLVFYIRDEYLHETIASITEEMLIPPRFMRQIPLTVDINTGTKWGSMTPYEAPK